MFERSYHFIPADRPGFFAKIGEVPADAFIFDLEDSVSAEKKADAIAFLRCWLADHEVPRPVFVRVNGPDERWAEQEAEVLAAYPRLGLVLPKTGTAAKTASAIRKYLPDGGRQVILLIEDPSTVPHLRDLTALPGVSGIGIGFEDLLSILCFARGDLATLVARIRTEVAMHCTAAGISAIDSISLDLSGGGELVAEATAARAAGMNAMFSIHPNQLAPINRIFTPTPEQVAEARRIVEAARDTKGSGGYRIRCGLLLTPPKVRKACAILEFSNHHEH